MIKSIRWWDGVALTLSLPAALFISLGYSIKAIGAWAAITLWATVAVLGALHNWLYSEMGTMFADKSGGIALYASEAWRQRLPGVAPLATYAYWFAWATAPAIWGLTVAQLAATQFFPAATFNVALGAWQIGLSQLIALSVALVSWALAMVQLRWAMLLITAAGVLLMIPTLIFSTVFLTGAPTSVATFSWHKVPGLAGVREVLAWLFVMAWSAYAVEAAASFIPEFRDTVADTRKALRVSALVLGLVFAATPLGITALLGEPLMSAQPDAFLQAGVAKLFGGGEAAITAILIAGVMVLSVMGTADAGRVLYQSARDGLTVRQFGRLNANGVPGRAITAQLLINVAMVLLVGNPLAVIVAGNVGYILAHLLAVSGFVLLRRDRPDAPRPIRLGPGWVGVAVVLTVFDAAILLVGLAGTSIIGYGGLKEVAIAIVVLGLSQALYYLRRWQDRTAEGASGA
jgi:amino acid transporter